MASQDIYAKLKKDHKSVQQILKKMVGTDEGDAAERRELLKQLKTELLTHAHAEEKLLYSELERHKPSHDIALEAEEEHHVAEYLLQELENCDVRDQHWKAKASVLQELLKHHIEEEEKTMFSKAHKVLDKEQEQTMARRFDAQKEKEMRTLQ